MLNNVIMHVYTVHAVTMYTTKDSSPRDLLSDLAFFMSKGPMMDMLLLLACLNHWRKTASGLRNESACNWY